MSLYKIKIVISPKVYLQLEDFIHNDMWTESMFLYICIFLHLKDI